ncbi:zinc-ribbon domain-containing protein [Actinomyces sp.]|uniref:zinc-ribbon domain-containing protein n=1 Tax=Actinomyces sp. TaxID=29317 RepID=UPI00291488D0|nr:zinc-ribbon domain-containing protein [Actinomyces sp.]MDU5231095.1 zinc-ribbon domain-containing protein [Actinomyces sp.]MDU6756597.1 zinc-ribbon domain-containing protein [Actinomyces sp.]
MKPCNVDGCSRPGAFVTRTKPTWCLVHLREIYGEGGLILLEDFTKSSAYLLTRCIQCGFEAHYRFDYVLDRLDDGEAVCRACYWRAWAKSARALAGITDDPVSISAIRKKAEENGYTYLGPLTNPSLADDPHATRCNFCGRIAALRSEDIGWGCPCRRNPKTATAGTKKARGANLLKNSDNRAVSWWDHQRNEESLWNTAKLKGRQEAWWICPEGHSFQARILDVTNKNFSCPQCASLRQAAQEREIAALTGKTIADVPVLLSAWDDDTPPDTVPVIQNHWGPGYKFRCPAGHRNTRDPRSYFFGGCSACKAIETRKANAKAADADPSSSRLTPEISSQWHPTRNGNLRLAEISPESRRTVWWQDPVCGHEFQATPRERDKYDRWRCPICRTILDSLAYHYPELAEEWSPENQLSPWMIRPNTTQLEVVPLWVCRNEASHVWRAMPSARVNGSRCPECLENGKSQIELEYYSSALAHWGNAKSGPRIHSKNFKTHSSWTVDILVSLPSGKRLIIEYDGCYWHRDKADIDHNKSMDLLAERFILVRLREAPLSSLKISHPNYYEVTVYTTAQDPDSDVARIADLVRE